MIVITFAFGVLLLTEGLKRAMKTRAAQVNQEGGAVWPGGYLHVDRVSWLQIRL